MNISISQGRTARLTGVGVYHSRIMAGRFLAIDSPVEADLVVRGAGVRECVALGYALESGIPYGKAFVKTDMWDEPLSSPNRATGSPASRSN